VKQWEEQTGYDLMVQNDELKTSIYPITVEPVRRRRHKRNREKGKLVMTAMSFGIIAAVSFQVVIFMTEELMPINRRENSQITTLANADPEVKLQQSAYTRNLVDVVSDAMPTVVSIIIIGQTEDKLIIATNQHVVDGTESLTVGFTSADGTTIGSEGWGYENNMLVTAQVEGTDAETITVGEQVVAIGNALGYGQSVTSGYVSAVNSATRMYIQTDADINPGNSGGALFNMRGEVIGINSAKISADAVEGMGFAIPVSTAVPILERLMA
jgi:serine protease Do